MAFTLPVTEERRLKCLQALGALDMGQDDWLDMLANRALAAFPGTSCAAVSLVGRDRQLFKGRANLLLQETPRSHSFCSHAILRQGALVVEDAQQDPRFTDNPLVTGSPGIRFYAGVPLRDNVGALCVIGLSPRQATASEISALTALAGAVGQRLAQRAAVQALTRQIVLD